MRKLLMLLVVIGFGSCSGKNDKNELLVFAAASLTDVITEIADSIRKESGIQLKLNFAASGTLARQIEQGANVGVYISANKKWKNYLVKGGFVQQSGTFAANELVLVSSKNDITSVPDIVEFLKVNNKKIAIGDPAYVPAGEYAMQVLNNFKLDLSSKLIHTVSVRSALMMVEMGEIPYAIVYKTDAVRSEKVEILYTFPKESHQPIEYYKLEIGKSNQSKDFYNYLLSSSAKKILSKYSFKQN